MTHPVATHDQQPIIIALVMLTLMKQSPCAITLPHFISPTTGHGAGIGTRESDSRAHPPGTISDEAGGGEERHAAV